MHHFVVLMDLMHKVKWERVRKEMGRKPFSGESEKTTPSMAQTGLKKLVFYPTILLRPGGATRPPTVEAPHAEQQARRTIPSTARTRI